MNDLYLIGNGFDLAHGLKTSYNDFLLWYLNDSLKQLWTKEHFEDELMKIERMVTRFQVPSDFDSISKLERWLEEHNYKRKAKHDYFENIIKNYREYNWIDIEYEYYMALTDIYKRFEKTGLVKDKNIDKEIENLNNCLELIKTKLEEYLNTIQIPPDKRSRQIEKRLMERTGIDEVNSGKKLFLYFNYTLTIDLYRNWSFEDKIQVIHIHGKLNDQFNPIIFGYGDEIEMHYEKIENLNNNEFLKNIKSFGYFKTTNYQDTIRFVESGDFTIKILGHSCGLSDRILLNTIFEHPNCKAIKIYYYQKSETENDYFEKTQEISRHFKASGKGDMRTKIISFEKSDPLVPFVAKN